MPNEIPSKVSQKKEACESKEAFEKKVSEKKSCKSPSPGLEPAMLGFDVQCLIHHSTRATDSFKANFLTIYVHCPDF